MPSKLVVCFEFAAVTSGEYMKTMDLWPYSNFNDSYL